MNAKRTPGRGELPWNVNGSETSTAIWCEDRLGNRMCTIKGGEDDADVAQFIVTAANCHDELVAALEALLAHCEAIPPRFMPNGILDARAALARAKGEA